MPADHRSAARLAVMSDAELVSLVDDRVTEGWGANGPITVDGTTLFLKRVPLTAVEHARPRSTRNHFRLPTYYSYGVGSAGFGAWRELAVHERTSAVDGFPTLVHQRVMTRTAKHRELTVSDEQYVRYWNGNAAIGTYMAARREATYEIWLVLEHVANELWDWLPAHQDRVDEVLDQLFRHLDTLHELGVVHFDAHFGNVVTDGEQLRLTDFGLAMAADFDLRAAERAFLARHPTYDHGIATLSLGLLLLDMLGEERETAPRLAWHLDHLEDLPPTVTAPYVDVLRRLRGPILTMMRFLDRMHRPSKRGGYDDADVRSQLRRAGVRISD